MADTWTVERIERLKKLWAEGVSCRDIALDLAGGITRNAVIGKITRLGLSGRVKARSSAAPAAAKPRSAPLSRRNPSNSLAAKIAIAAAEPGLPDNLKGEAPDGAGVKLIDLNDKNCHWPKGHPIEVSFEFCGARALKDLPYCAHHSRIAYLPRGDRRRQHPRA